jgi:hypothetical protein
MLEYEITVTVQSAGQARAIANHTEVICDAGLDK